MNGYPRVFPRILLAFFLLTAGSGIALIPGALESRFDGPAAPSVFRAHRVALAAVHVGGGGLLLMVFGAVWPIHMRAGWRRKRNVCTGLSASLVFLLLPASALPLLYASGEGLTSGSSGLHIAAGLLLPCGAILHIRSARRRLEPESKS